MQTVMNETDPELSSFRPLDPATGKTVQLSMQQLLLTGRILPVGARLFVRHTFSSSSQKPVEAVYSFILPRDAALRRFRVSGPGFSARSELRPVEEANEAYESGLEGGHLATLARVYRDGMVNLSVGNLRAGEPVTVLLEILAGVDLRDDGLRFRFPFTVAPSYHRSARAIAIDDTAAEIELPEDEFGDLLLPQFRTCSEGLHEVGFDLSVEAPAEDLQIASPSHNIRAGLKPGRARVSTAAADGAPNRDLVLDIGTKKPARRILAGRASDGRLQFAAVLPAAEFGRKTEASRSVVFVIDRSGSMAGAPIAQARRALLACLATLSDADQFGIVAFDNEVETFASKLLAADRGNRERAREWLGHIEARGGTELAQAVNEAARFAGEGADLFVLTDGQVWGTEEISARARRSGARLHTLGIGSASQDRFLTLLARGSGGVSRFVTPRERVDTAALDWFASVSAPVAAALSVDAPDGVTVEPQPPAVVFQGVPVLISGSAGSDSATIGLRWQSGHLDLQIPPAAGSSGETLRLLRGARLLTDAETESETSSAAAGRRGRLRELRRVERLSREYGLASQAMALVAVIERTGDKPGEIPETQVIPVGLPEGMEVTSSAISPMMHPPASARRALSMKLQAPFEPLTPVPCERRATPAAKRADFPGWPVSRPGNEALEDELFELAASLESDGGMPGKTLEKRVLASLLALLAFAAAGSTPESGPFRTHVKLLAAYLNRALPAGLAAENEEAARELIRAATQGEEIAGDWLGRVRSASLSTRAESTSAWEALRNAAAGG